MAKLTELLIWSPAIEPTVARITVVASCEEPVEGMRLQGSLQGPTCTYAKTIEGETALVPQPVTAGIEGEGAVQAEAKVMEPCLWEPEHPFLYQMQIELCHGEKKLDAQSLSMGIRHLACGEQGLRLNGKGTTLSAARIPEADLADESSFRSWREAGCQAVVVEHVSSDLLGWADRWGVFVLVRLGKGATGLQQTDDGESISTWRLHPSVAMWLVDHEESIDAVRRRDPFRPITLMGSVGDLPEQSTADLHAVIGSHRDVVAVAERGSKPLLAWLDEGEAPNADAFSNVVAQRLKELAEVPHLAGIVV